MESPIFRAVLLIWDVTLQHGLVIRFIYFQDTTMIIMPSVWMLASFLPTIDNKHLGNFGWVKYLSFRIVILNAMRHTLQFVMWIKATAKCGYLHILCCFDIVLFGFGYLQALYCFVNRLCYRWETSNWVKNLQKVLTCRIRKHKCRHQSFMIDMTKHKEFVWGKT